MKAKKKLNFIDKIFLWITFLLCAGLLLSYLAPVINPTKFWMIAFFGLAYPFLLLANGILVVYWLLRKNIWVFLPLICIGIGWNMLNRNIGLRFPQAAGPVSGPNTVRIMTYNVHNFKHYGAKNDISTKHEILDIIAGEQPDVIGFQEFYTRAHGQYDMLDSVQNILKCNGYYFESIIGNKMESIGMALFSKFPLVSHGFIRLSEGPSENQCIYVDIKKGAQTIRVYSVHLQSIKFDPEDYRYLNDVSQQGKPDVGSAKRLGSKLKTAFLKRSAQVLRIKNSADSCKYPYVISGDFNDTPASYAVNQMSRGLKNAFAEKGSGLGRTYNGSFPNFQIDYIMASQQFDVKSYHIIEKRLSDHYPVCSDLVLK